MSDTERRFERPASEPPLTIDNRRRAQARGPAPVTLIVSVALLIVVVGAVFYMYRSGSRATNGAPQPLGAPLGDVRAPAPAQAQTPDPSAGLTISKDDAGAIAGPPTLAPPPEQPLPPAAAHAAKQFPIPGPPPPPPPESAMVDPDTPVLPTVKAPSGEQADKGDAIDRLISKSEKRKAPAAADGSVVIQIGAFSSERLADRQWSMAAAVAPGAMAGKGKRVLPVTKDGATLYRTAITGFSSRDQALALCDKLKAAGGSCFVH
jgi:hypothetical protein